MEQWLERLERLKRLERVCEVAVSGTIASLDTIIEEDGLILDKIAAECFNWKSPLHVAVWFGKLQFVEKLLDLKPVLAEALDSRDQSALHLAAAKGAKEIVKVLIEKSPEMCFTRDRDGRNPLHVAAMKGKVDALKELVKANPLAARDTVNGGETILHLCVKCNQLTTLGLLLDTITDEEFVNAKDSDGNNILDIAALAKRQEIIDLVLKKSIVDLPRFLQPAIVPSKIFDESKGRLKDALMVVTSFMTAIAFQAATNPPGGVWKDNSDGHRAGEAVMAYNHPQLYLRFMRTNTIGFIGALSGFLLLTNVTRVRVGVLWILAMIMWIAIVSVTSAYAFSVVAVTPMEQRPVSRTIVLVVILWLCSMLLVQFQVPLLITGLILRRIRPLAPQLEPQLEPQLAPQLEPQLAPQIQPQLEPQLAPN